MNGTLVQPIRLFKHYLRSIQKNSALVARRHLKPKKANNIIVECLVFIFLGNTLHMCILH
nr:MAG TPA: hypothetical protein [Caudoviricetes sp.]